MRSVTNDPELIDAALGQTARDLARPVMRRLSVEQRADLERRYGSEWAETAAALIEIELHEQNEEAAVLSEESFGRAIQAKGRETVWKRAIPEPVEPDRAGEAQRLTDQELLGLVSVLGLLPGDTDSSRTVPRNSASPLMLPDAIGSVRQPEDEHR